MAASKRLRAGEDDAMGALAAAEDRGPTPAASKRALFLKPEASKRPWYLGGKAVFSRDGSTLYCAHEGGVGVVKNYATVETVVAKGDDVVSFTIASGPQTLATCSRRGLIRVFRHDLTELRSFSSLHTGPVSEMDFEPTGELLATGSTDYTVKVFSVSGGYVTHNFKGHRGIISAVKFHPNEGTLLLATADVTGAVCIWDLRTRKGTWFRSHLSCVPSVAFLSSNHLVTVGRDRVLNLWARDQPNTPLKTVPTYESMESVVSLGDSTHFITGGSSGVLKKWRFDTLTNECTLIETVPELYNACGDSIFQLSIVNGYPSQNDGTLVSISQTECLFTFRSATSLGGECTKTLVGFDDEIFDIAFLKRKDRVAVVTNSPIVRVYSFGADVTSPFDAQLLVGHEDAVLSIGHSEKFIVTGSKDQTARVWDAESFEVIGKCEGHTDSVSAVAVCNKPSNANIFSTGSDDCSIRLWLFNQEVECLDQRIAHSKPILDVCFSPNDEMIASSSADKTCKLWQLERGTGKKTLQISSLICELKGHKRAVNSVRFSPIDRVVCTTSADTSIRIWSIPNGVCVRTLQGHSAPTTSAIFMSNGSSLVSSSSDGSLKTWDLKTSLCGQTLSGSNEGGHDDRVWALAQYKSNEDEYVASVSSDGVIALWKDGTQEVIQQQAMLEREEIMAREELDRSLREKRYMDAAKLALKMDRPHQLRQILEAIPPEQIPEFVNVLVTESTPSKVNQLLNAIVQWNTLARSSLTAQRALTTCTALGNKLEKIIGASAFQKFIKASLPYTERHFTRIDKLLKTTYVLDRVLETNALV